MRFPKLIFLAYTLAAQEKLPDGPGKEAIQKICTTCHEVDTVFGTRRTRTGWERTVEKMLTHGAKGSDDEIAAIIDYLTWNFGKANVNTASAEDLEKTLSLPAKEAEAIRAYREKNGKLKDFEDLKKIPGVNPDQLEEKRALITFNQ